MVTIVFAHPWRGNKAEYKQIRARWSRYSDMFEALPENFIKLRKMEDNSS
ncbi:hypothetical protein [Tissierella praeacuta]